MSDDERDNTSAPRGKGDHGKPGGDHGKPSKPEKPGGDHGGGGKGRGKLVLDINGVETALPAGHALALALSACTGSPPDPMPTVADVRDASPDPVTVCDGVTLRALVGGDEDEDVTEGQPA